ncbi:hypothetical protein Golax_001026, partial [Gossypium laxum]|nr:hypothetical protein [Gossypium laxum]
RYLYKNWVQEKIGSLVRKVAKLDIKTNSRARDQFSMMAVFVDLKKPLTSQVLINERVQRVNNDDGKGDASNPVVKEVTPATMGEAFGPWMAIECKSRPLNPLGKDLMRLEEKKVDIMGVRFQKGDFLKLLKDKKMQSKSRPTGEEILNKRTLGQDNGSESRKHNPIMFKETRRGFIANEKTY